MLNNNIVNTPHTLARARALPHTHTHTYVRAYVRTRVCVSLTDVGHRGLNICGFCYPYPRPPPVYDLYVSRLLAYISNI